MFDNEQQVSREMCRGHICMYHLATFEYFLGEAAATLGSMYKQQGEGHITAAKVQ